VITILVMLLGGCATPESPQAQPTASAVPPYPLPATPTPVTTQIPTTTFTATPPTSPTPLRTPTNTIPPPPNPSRIPTETGATRTPTPNRFQHGTPPAKPPPIPTPLPISKIIDKAPYLLTDQKAEAIIRRADGTYEKLLIDYSVKASTYLEVGDELITVIPPMAIPHYPPPKLTAISSSTVTPTQVPYPLPTR
jgi:hypothetical protein